MKSKEKYYSLLIDIDDFKIKNKRSMTKEEALLFLEKEQDISFLEITQLIKEAVSPISNAVTLQRAFPLDMERITKEQYEYLLVSLKASVVNLFKKVKEINGEPSEAYTKHEINAIYALMEHFDIDENYFLLKKFGRTFKRNDNSFDDRVPKAIIYEDEDKEIDKYEKYGMDL